MQLKYVLLAFAFVLVTVSAKIDPTNLKCLVCRQIFEELHQVIKGVEKWKKVDVGNFRMDADGNTMQKKVPAHRSAMYISDVIDSICKKMDDYVRVNYKATGKLAIMLLLIPGAGMNPEFSKAKIVTDDDLNKSLEYYCERMFEENEEEITDLYTKRPDDDIMPDAERAICFNHTKYCEEWMLPNEKDTTWTPEMEAEYVKIHGPDPYGFGGQAQSPVHNEVTDSEGYDDGDDEEDEEVDAEDEESPGKAIPGDRTQTAEDEVETKSEDKDEL